MIAGNKNSIWFQDVKDGISFDREALKSIIRYISACIISKARFNEEFSQEIRKDDLPRIVFISVSDGNSKADIFIGRSNGILAAVDQAISKVFNKFNEKNACWVKVDFVNNVYDQKSFEVKMSQDLDESLYGIATDESTEIAILNDEITFAYLVDMNNGEFIYDNCCQYFKDRFPSFLNFTNTEGNFWNLFTTVSFFTDGDEIIYLYRGHRLFDEIKPDDLIFAAKQASKYLVNAVNPDGMFNYLYNPVNDQILPQYNILRHCGTIYSMLELYELLGDKDILDACVRAIEYLMTFIRPFISENSEMACVVEEDEVKLGGHGLALVALSKYTELTKDYTYMETMVKLAKWIKYAQSDDGDFYIHKQIYSNTQVTYFISGYYAGEAILGLLRLYNIYPDKEWLNVSVKAADYIIENQEQLTINNHDHWLLYALNDLHQFSPNAIYIEHSLKIAKSIIDSQVLESVYPDITGCFKNVIRSTPVATRTEGLIAAYKLCKNNDYLDELQKISDTIKLGVRFQLQNQFAPENAMYFEKPELILGAFHCSLTNFDIRIDFIQHNISSIIGLYRNIIFS